MARKNKLTPNQDTYKELRRRLKRKLRDLKKRGMTPNRAFNEEWLGNEIPDKVRKATLEKMRKALKNIYEFVRYYDPLKEKYISGVERRKQERAEAARKGWEKRREDAMKIDQFWEDFDEYRDVYESYEYWGSLPNEEMLILEEVEHQILTWEASPTWSEELKAIKREDRNLLKSILDGAINELGRTQVAHNIKGRSEELLQYVNDVLYSSGDKFKRSGRDGVMNRIQQIRDILYGRPSTVEESIELTRLAESLNEGE